MTDVTPFEFDGFGACRFGADDDGTPWVVASEFAKLMGYRDAEKAARLLDGTEKGTRLVGTPGGPQKMLVLFEDGVLAWALIGMDIARRPRAYASRDVRTNKKQCCRSAVNGPAAGINERRPRCSATIFPHIPRSSLG